MKTRNRKGSTKLGVLLFILLCASIALNVILLKGDGILGIGEKSGGGPTVNPPSLPNSESSYLRELAGILKLDVRSEKTSGDMAFDIRQRLNKRLTYSGDVLPLDSFEKASAAIRITKDQETFKAYHEFIRKVAGKTIIVLE